MSRCGRLVVIAILTAAPLVVVVGACGDSTFTSANVDASTADAANASDANEDAVSDSGLAADSLSPCSSRHDICDDFDRDDAAWPGSNWRNAQGLTALTFSSDASVSPPRSLLAHYEGSGSIGTAGLLSAVIARPIASTSCSFDFRIDEVADPAVQASIFSVTMYDAASQRFTTTLSAQQALDNDASSALSLGYGLTFADGGGVGGSTFAIGEAISDQWVHVTFSLTPASGTFSIALGGVGVLTRSSLPRIGDAVLSAVQIGVYATNGPWQVYYDNVACDGN